MESVTPSELSRLEQEGEVAADYLEDLLDIVDLDGDIEIDVDGRRALVEIVSDNADSLHKLIGTDGNVLDSLQELTRLAVQIDLGERSGLMLDIGGFRLQRRHELAALTEEAINRFHMDGTPQALNAMNPFERKVCHDVVAAAGLSSHSEGRDADRHVVITAASTPDDIEDVGESGVNDVASGGADTMESSSTTDEEA